MKKAVLAIVVAAIYSGSAPQAVAANVWTPGAIPSSIQVTEGGGFIVYFPTNFSATCGNRVHIYPGQHVVTEGGAKAMLASALAALSAEKTISVMYDDGTQYCWGRYLTIER